MGNRASGRGIGDVKTSGGKPAIILVFARMQINDRRVRKLAAAEDFEEVSELTEMFMLEGFENIFARSPYRHERELVSMLNGEQDRILDITGWTKRQLKDPFGEQRELVRTRA